MSKVCTALAVRLRAYQATHADPQTGEPMSDNELARKIGIGTGTMNDVFHNRRPASRPTLDKIITALGWDAGEVFRAARELVQLNDAGAYTRGQAAGDRFNQLSADEQAAVRRYAEDQRKKRRR